MNFLRDIEAGVAKLVATPALDGLLSVAVRVLLAFIFIMAGYSKIGGYEGTQGYMEAMGVPGFMLPLVILLELGGGLALLIGLQTRLIAAALAGFCVISGVLFHSDPDSIQQIMLMKNFAIAGGLLALVRTGAGRFGVDKV